ncbi:cell division cycle-associated 7-like protein isoform X3 [Salvia hispanica]|uniref:cell division cycle-associated 7-like protein isoform X3 n=1 Tax=Salvia hispanica TaxID=49212 RepID=UPI002009B00A|nr:cell division cycle-associated 7-like protein isoform X3 [Salvia hispanica]
MQMTLKDSRAKFPNSAYISIENFRRCTLRNHQNHSAGKFRFQKKENRMKENFRSWISEYYTEMAVEASPGSSVASPSAENVKSTRKSAAGSQVSNSGDGVYCHQCRQKTRAPAAACKNLTKKKPCSVKMCCRCLWNRYGEKVEEVAKLEDWKCPKCRGICNCSVCMKRRGLQPLGVLTRASKATGKVGNGMNG